MKKLVVMLIVLSAFLYFNGYRGPKTRVLRIGVECAYEPNNWEETRKTDSNVPLANHPGLYVEGYDIQIALLVADEINANVEFYKLAWQDLLPALNRGEIDAVFSGMFDTEERRKLAAFTETYESAKSEYGIIVNKHSKYSGARTLEDFSGAKLLAQRSTKLDSAIDQVPGAVHMPPVDTVSETLQRVVNGEVDGLVINVDTGRSYERTYSNLKLITFPAGKGFTLDFHGVCAGVRKRDKELLHDINDAIRSISLRERKRIMDASISRVWRNF